MKLLVSDYDGTFDTSVNDIELNCKKIKEFMEDGNLFVLSSGRSLKSLSNKVKEHNIPYSFLSCADGSFLFDNENSMHFAYTMSHDSIYDFHELIDLKRHKKFEYAFPEDYSEEYDKFKLLGSLAFTIENKKINKEFLNTWSKLTKQYPEYQYNVYGYDGLTFYLIRPHGVSKASPIGYLEGMYNIPRDEIYTIGDNSNDKELIRDYNGYRIGSNSDLIPVSIQQYESVNCLIDDINNKKVLKRW